MAIESTWKVGPAQRDVLTEAVWKKHSTAGALSDFCTGTSTNMALASMPFSAAAAAIGAMAGAGMAVSAAPVIALVAGAGLLALGLKAVANKIGSHFDTKRQQLETMGNALSSLARTAPQSDLHVNLEAKSATAGLSKIMAKLKASRVDPVEAPKPSAAKMS